MKIIISNNGNLLNNSYPFGMGMPTRSWSAAGENYRFGFNGQLQVDEVSGEGNHNTALFWEYDTRLGRRWNTDPKPIAHNSVYSCYLNNPIIFKDIKGDTSIFYNGKTGDLLAIVYDNLPNEVIILKNPNDEDIKYYSSFNKNDGYLGEYLRSHATFGSILEGKEILVNDLYHPTKYFSNQGEYSEKLKEINKEIIVGIVRIDEIKNDIEQLNGKIYELKKEKEIAMESIQAEPGDPHVGQDLSRLIIASEYNKKIDSLEDKKTELNKELNTKQHNLHELHSIKKELFEKKNN